MSRALLVLAAIIGCVVADHHEGHGSQEAVAGGEKAWEGKWESTGRQENFEAFIAALQVPLEPHGDEKVYHSLWKEGDHYHHKISVPSKQYKNDVQFKLGEEGTSNFNNTEFKYKYSEEADGLHAQYTLPAKNKVINDHYKVTGDDLEKTYKVGDVQAKKWYKRVKNTAA